MQINLHIQLQCNILGFEQYNHLIKRGCALAIQPFDVLGKIKSLWS
jgi:hypothetical protein